MKLVNRRGRRAAVLSAAVGVIVVSATSSAQAGLAHRYSFTTDASDSVGTANGSLINGATVSGNQLVTAGGGSGAAGTAPAASLNGVGATTGISGDFTVEDFFTRGATATNNYATLWSFAAGATDTNNYLIATAGRGDSTAQFSTAYKQAGVNGGGELVLRGPQITAGSTHSSATTFNSATGTATLFVDGVATARSTVLSGFNLSTLGTKAGVNGNAPWPDPGHIGTNDDFRIYNDASSALGVAMRHLAGPDNLAIVGNVAGTSGDYGDSSIWSGGVPTANQQVTTAAGSVVTQNSGSNTAGTLTVNGTLNVSGGSLTSSTVLDLGSNASVNLNSGGTLAVRGILINGELTSANSAAINFNGGSLVLNGTTGATTVATLTTRTNGSTIAPSTSISYNVTAPSSIAANSGFLSAASVVGSSALSKTGTGDLGLNGDLSGFSGSLNVNQGTVYIAAPGARTVAGSNPHAFNIGFDSTNSGTAATLVVSQVNAVEHTGQVTLGAPATATVYSIQTVDGTNGNFNLAGKITGGNANSTLNLTGFFKISGANNDYQGKTQFNGSTSAAIASGNAFGNSTLVFNNGGLEGTQSITGSNRVTNNGIILSTNTAAQPLFVNGSNDVELSGNITSNATDVGANEIQKVGLGKIILSGNVTIGGNAGLNNVTGTGGTVAAPRVFQVNGKLTSTGTGRFLYVDTGGSNGNGETEYAAMANGATIQGLQLYVKGRATNANVSDRPVSGLILDSISGNNTLTAGISIRATGGGYSIRTQSGSTLNIGGSMSGNVSGATPREFELTGAGNGVITANVANTNGATPTLVGLAMVGETTGSDTTGRGMWSLNSTGNAFTGGVSVIDGTLLINGSTTATAILSTNQAYVYGGTLGGTGSIAQPVTVYAAGTTTVVLAPNTPASLPNVIAYAATSNNNKGGTLAPGSDVSPIGTLTAGSTVTINGAFSAQADGSGGGASDKLVSTGALTLGANSVLNFTNIGAGQLDDGAYIIASYPAGGLTGTFGTVNLPSTMSVVYNYNNTNQIAVVPEPATIAALGAIGGLMLSRRRRNG